MRGGILRLSLIFLLFVGFVSGIAFSMRSLPVTNSPAPFNVRSMILYDELSKSLTSSYNIYQSQISLRPPLALWDLVNSNSHTSQNLKVNTYKFSSFFSMPYLMNKPSMRLDSSSEHLPEIPTSLIIQRAVRKLNIVYYVEDVSSLTGNAVDYRGGVALQYFITNRLSIASSHHLLNLTGDKLTLNSPTSSISATYTLNSSTSITLDLEPSSTFNLSDPEKFRTSLKVLIRF